MRSDVDAVVIGAGHNGLVAANVLAEHGWRVLVLEEQPVPGGAVKSGEITEPGFTSDLFSAFYPLARGVAGAARAGAGGPRPALAAAPLPVAHPQPDGALRRAVARPRRDGRLAGALRARRRRALARLLRHLEAGRRPVHGRAAAAVPAAARRRAAGGARSGRAGCCASRASALLPVRRLAEERFRGEGAAWLLAGNALHADLTPDSAGGGLFGWVLCGLGQEHGFPVPEGGAGRLVDALVTRLRAHGGELACGAAVVAGDRARRARGRRAAARRLRRVARARGVLATTVAPTLFHDLVGDQHLPRDFVEDLDRFQLDNGTVKVDWSLDAADPVGRARRRDAPGRCTSPTGSTR